MIFGQRQETEAVNLPDDVGEVNVAGKLKARW